MSRLKTIYRVELPDDPTKGAYHSADKIQQANIWFSFRDPTHAVRWPSPFSDGLRIGDFTEDHFFGFETKKQLHDWFGDRLVSLAAAGFRVSEYQVPSYYVISASRQSLFLMSAAMKVR